MLLFQNTLKRRKYFSLYQQNIFSYSRDQKSIVFYLFLLSFKLTPSKHLF